jgi:hypothetical protein
MKKQLNTFEELQKELIIDLAVKHGQTANDKVLLNADVFFPIKLPVLLSDDTKEELVIQSIFFRDCDFYDEIKLEHNSDYLFFENCKFHTNIVAYNSTFKGKVRFRNCEFFGELNFKNATFNQLADFWSCTFHKPITFYKTDFLSTSVFSSAVFVENVLFTYTLFDGKTIFGRTKFNKGFDISQSIIAGELQPFDLAFDFTKYETEYISNDDNKFRKYIELENKIPLINKVATFQILKNIFAKKGNHIDEITMRQQEKKSYSKLTQLRKLDKNWKKNTSGDRFILWLNRWSNNYKSDFRNGISFTIIAAIAFLLLTFATTGEFLNRICFNCEIDSSVIVYTVKQFINFLNPVHNINYIDELRPFWGIPYVFDFLGRIAVGYGIYQTVQAFRKFR